MAHTTGTQPATTRAVGALRTEQVFATLSVINLLYQFVTAGQLFPDGGPRSSTPRAPSCSTS